MTRPCRFVFALITTGFILPGLLLDPPAQPTTPSCVTELVPPTDIGGGI